MIHFRRGAVPRRDTTHMKGSTHMQKNETHYFHCTGGWMVGGFGLGTTPIGAVIEAHQHFDPVGHNVTFEAVQVPEDARISVENGVGTWEGKTGEEPTVAVTGDALVAHARELVRDCHTVLRLLGAILPSEEEANSEAGYTRAASHAVSTLKQANWCAQTLRENLETIGGCL